RAGISLSCSSRKRASSSSAERSGAFCSLMRRSLRSRACALRWLKTDPMRKAAAATTTKTMMASKAADIEETSDRASDLRLRFEQGGAQARARGCQTIGKLGASACGPEDATHLSAFVDPGTLENENILHRDGVIGHARHLGNGDHFARSVGQARNLDD